MSEFYTLSQLAISIAGFAALFSILKPESSKWQPTDISNLIRFYVMIELACITATFCFFPIMFLGYFEDSFSYRLSFFLCAICLSIYYYLSLRRNRITYGEVNFAGNITILIRIVGICAITYSFLNFFGIIGCRLKANYLILMYLGFVVSLFHFIRLIYHSIQKEEKNQTDLNK